MPIIKGITIQQVLRMVEMYEAGWSLKYIAEEFDLAVSTVRYHLEAQGVAFRPQGANSHTRLSYNDIKKTIFLYHTCQFSAKVVSELIGCSESAVRSRLRRAGAPPRARGIPAKVKTSSDLVSF